MDQSAAVLDELNSTLVISKRMLSMAETGDWDNLVECERERQKLIGDLRRRAEKASLIPEGSPERERALQLVAEILETDRQTEHLAKSWMSQIANDLGEIERARRVSAAYEAR